jgi:hypothetical protein
LTAVISNDYRLCRTHQLQSYEKEAP